MRCLWKKSENLCMLGSCCEKKIEEGWIKMSHSSCSYKLLNNCCIITDLPTNFLTITASSLISLEQRE